jgi:hypothetical protein
VSTPSPFDVLHEHFGNIGALDMSFYFIGLQVLKKMKSKKVIQLYF